MEKEWDRGDYLRALKKRVGEDFTLEVIAERGGWRGPTGPQRYFEKGKVLYPVHPRALRKLIKALVGQGSPAITLEEVMRVGDEFAPLSTSIGKTDGAQPPAEGVGYSRAENAPAPLNIRRDVPVKATVPGANRGDFQMPLGIAEQVNRPAALDTVTDAYAIYMVGTSMGRAYKNGDLIYVSPRRPPSPDDDILIQLKGVAREGMVRVLVAVSDTHYTVQQLSPEKTVEIPKSDVEFIHRIYTRNDLAGV